MAIDGLTQQRQRRRVRVPNACAEEAVRGRDLQVVAGVGAFAAGAGPGGGEVGLGRGLVVGKDGAGGGDAGDAYFVGGWVGAEADVAVDAEGLRGRH